MKLAVSALVLLLAVWSLEAASPTAPAELKRLASRSRGGVTGLLVGAQLAAAANDPKCYNRSRSCASCNSVNECAYIGMGYRLLSTKACPDSTPFCFNGQCQKKSSSDACGSSPPVTNEFTCIDATETQYYPAPFSCSKYYVCNQGTAYVYNCAADQVYDQTSASCVRLDKNPNSCASFNCAANAGRYLLYRPDPSVYAYCVDANNALVSKCPANYRMNPYNGEEPCKPVCSAPGRFADVETRTAYYNCLELEGGVLSPPQKEYCPPGLIFRAAAKRCVRETEIIAEP